MNEERWGSGEGMPWFVAVVPGHIEVQYLNDYINFPPIIKKSECESSEKVLGKYVYSFMKEHNFSLNKKETRLTQLLSTHGQLMSFGMYELWGLIDTNHFVTDECACVILFTKHDRIGRFVNKLFEMKVCAKTKGENELCKNILNSSYGADGQNNEKFTNITFMGKRKALFAAAEFNFVNSTKINDDLYLVEREPRTASCKKPLQSAFATLSNAKYWFIRFVYGFMYKCLDMSRIHFIVCDTDSYMWAVAGTGEREKLIREGILAGVSERGRERVMSMIVPHFEEVVVDREFYEKHYQTWFPRKKTLLTLEYEHCCRNMIALAPKNYYHDGKVKLKGVSTRGNLNKHINEQAFLDNIEKGKKQGQRITH
jgi:hypothetical protein